MCIDLQYFYPMCGHYEYGGWMCRNLYWNKFCDSPYMEDEVIDGERCGWCNTIEDKRKVVLEEMKNADVIDLVEDGDEGYMAIKKEEKKGDLKKKEKKITDHFSVGKSKSVAVGPAKAASW